MTPFVFSQCSLEHNVSTTNKNLFEKKSWHQRADCEVVLPIQQCIEIFPNWNDDACCEKHSKVSIGANRR